MFSDLKSPRDVVFYSLVVLAALALVMGGYSLLGQGFMRWVVTDRVANGQNDIMEEFKNQSEITSNFDSTRFNSESFNSVNSNEGNGE